MPKRRPRKSRPTSEGLTSPVEILTVLWSMTVMMGLLCDVGVAVTRLWYRSVPEAKMIGVLSGVLLLSAVVMAVLSLALLPFVLRLRKTMPPPGFLALAVIVAVAPLLVVLVENL